MNLSERILKLLGWKVINSIGPLPKKAVVIAGPHTSNWDFVYGFLFFKAVNLKGYFLIKEEIFVFPLGAFLRYLGGIPVRRKGKNSIVDDVVKLFAQKDEMALTITPEGTRSLSKEWKAGYHRIALAANVPVIVGALDYKHKIAEVLATYNLEGDFKNDTLQIQKLYLGKNPKFPEKFYLPPEVLNGEV